MKTETEIRRRKGGSIDTAYYMAKGHDARSAEAHKMGHSFWHHIMRALQIRHSKPNPTKTEAHSH